MSRAVNVLEIIDAAGKTCLRYSHMRSAERLPEAYWAVRELLDACASISRYATDTEWQRFHQAVRDARGIK